MDKIDFVELATFCVNRYKETHTGSGERYEGTLYAAIFDNNEVRCSTTPHILRNAEQCILIHHRSQIAISNWYSWYFVEYINTEGCVCGSNLDNGYSLDINAWGSFANQVMSLDYNGSHLYWCDAPWDLHLPQIWELYNRIKNVKSEKEINLIEDLFSKDEKILKLEKEIENFTFSNHLLMQERDQFRNLLKEIRDIVENKG